MKFRFSEEKRERVKRSHTEVIVTKTEKASEKLGNRSLFVGGGRGHEFLSAAFVRAISFESAF